MVLMEHQGIKQVLLVLMVLMEHQVQSGLSGANGFNEASGINSTISC
jgi:hypothetical protein